MCFVPNLVERFTAGMEYIYLLLFFSRSISGGAIRGTELGSRKTSFVFAFLFEFVWNGFTVIKKAFFCCC